MSEKCYNNDMSFTESQKALIGDIVEEKMRPHTLTAKENNEKLTLMITKLSESITVSMREMASSITAQMQKDLSAVQQKFDSDIKLMIQERRNDIATLDNKMKLCKSNCDHELKEIGNRLITASDVWWIMGKAGGLIGGTLGFAGFIAYLIIKG